VVSVPGDQTVSTEGSGQSVTGSVTDLAGNSASVTVTGINIDKTAPVISGAPTTAANGAGWWKTNVAVHFTASDVGGSGVSSVTADQTVSTEGSGQSVAGTAVDVAGNSASFTVTGINIDKTAPTISGNPTTGPGSNGWYKSDVTVHFTVSDSGSGIASAPTDLVVSSQGKGQSVTGTVTDLAGNTAQSTVSGINIDKSGPTTARSLSGTLGNDAWYMSDVQVTLTSTDVASGVATTAYSFDNAHWYVYTAPFTISSGGTTTVYHNSTDNAGDVEATQSFEVNIAYSVTFTMSGLPSETQWGVTLGTTTLYSTSDSITFRVKPGNYNWNVSTTISGSDGNQYLASLSFGLMNIPDNASQSIAYETPTMITPLWWVFAAITSMAAITSTTFFIRRRRKNQTKP
jgi:ribosomal protein L24